MGNEASMEEMINAYYILHGKPDGMEDNIKMDLAYIGYHI
jgi:hypothetical protein